LPNLRQYSRITDTRDLLASLRAIGRPRTVGRVINLSEGGMLVAGGVLKTGEVTGFELHGPGFRYSGVASVAHCTDGATGLKFLCWQGQADRAMRALIATRSSGQTGASNPRQRSHRVRRVAVFVGTGKQPQPRPGGPAAAPPAPDPPES